MNVATLARMKVVSGTAQELIEAIRASARHQRYGGLVESALYLLPDKPDEILALAMWDNINNLPDFDENYRKPVHQGVVARGQVIGRQTYRLVKDYRTVSTTIGASHLRLMTIHTSQPAERLKLIAKKMGEIRKASINSGHVGGWLGRLVGETEAENTLTILIRHDFRDLEGQQVIQNLPLLNQIRAQNQAEGIKVEFASLDLAGLVRTQHDGSKSNERG
jgi:hypothetical protein